MSTPLLPGELLASVVGTLVVTFLVARVNPSDAGVVLIVGLLMSVGISLIRHLSLGGRT